MQERTFRWALAGLVGGSLLLRVWDLGRASLWIDEMLAYNIALQPVPDILAWRDNTPPLYNLLLHFWMHVAGTSEAALRLPSALFGAAAVGVVALAGRRLVGPRAGLLGAALVSLNLYMVNVSQMVRSYALLLLCSAWAFLALLRLMERGTPARRAAYAVANVLLLYTHVFGAFFVLAQAAYALAERRRSRPMRVVFGLQALACGAFALWAPILLAQAPIYVNNWMQRPSLQLGFLVAQDYTGGKLGLLCALGVAALAAWAGWSRAFDRQDEKEDRAPSASPSPPRVPLLLLLWLLVPLAVPLAVSLVKPVFTPKYALPAAVPLALAVAALAVRTGPAWRQGALAVLLVAATAVPLAAPSLYGPEYFGTSMDWRSATAYLDANVEPGGLLLAEWSFCGERAPDNFLCPLPYYSNRTDWRAVSLVDEQVPCPAKYRGDPDPLAVAGDKSRVWVLLVGTCHEGRFTQRLGTSYDETDRRDFGTVRILEFGHRTA